MPTLNHNQYSLKEMLSLIQRGQPFTGELIDAGCLVKIDEYLPVVCTAIHAGSRLRADLIHRCVLTDSERLFEEDPFTDDMIASQPITIVGLDSRFEYDLNRALTLSTYYKSAWNRLVWKKPLSARHRAESHRKHNAFYTIYEAIIAKLESLHDSVVVFDMHSYNYKRQRSDAPVFNIGTAQIDMERWGSVVQRFCSELAKVSLPNITTTAEINGVFEGRGYLISHTNAHFDRTLVLPTEVKKVFMEEETGTPFPLVLEALQSGLKASFSQTSAFVQRKFTKKRSVKKADMLSSHIEPNLIAVDKQLYQLAGKVETLKYVNPTNLQAEFKRFEAAPSRYKPNYRYRQLPINVSEFKLKLYRLPIESISDPDMRQLYGDMVQKLNDKMDLLTSVGNEAFLYNALRYHGRPDSKDLNNARFLLYAKLLGEDNNELLDSTAAIKQLSKSAVEMGMKCKVTGSNTLAAKAMVTANPPTLYLNSKALFSTRELKRLAQHELGVHMATNYNARSQQLKILRLGLPGSTVSQEGLAILAEYKSGYLSHERLNMLAKRVLAVDSMLKEQNFYQTYSYLHDELKLDKVSAFSLTTRVYRGGGFTKDHLYLKGFLQALNIEKSRSIENLMVGKCSFRYHDLLDELMNRGWLNKPIFLPTISRPNNREHTLDYLIESLVI
ncbi:flavohemoglobin expression-modulating QEGLA motif protein [Vibrio coralliilyticus]|uniref:flavohemoglobin expression-modulating QEGLA motif protein n=1 Tax=Vibrio coralliilyticus TaxID=190893 RepID=UPI000BAC1C98|nr:flavohemoglobin expression-modulating QEGLA motif protein [Vibrio coralliilyticus]NOI75920.1 flavohemoglobin expression-modulating QEGLA motif protein [Vibrio coralliilyticus]PAW04034.1 N-formylglutamate amidohydrolase [Vibrio coralliilyticus]